MNQELEDAAACICTGQTLYVRLPDGSTFLGEMTLWLPSWKYDIVTEIRLRQSMRIYLKNNPATFHTDPTLKNKAGRPNRKKKLEEYEQQEEYRHRICSWSKISIK